MDVETQNRTRDLKIFEEALEDQSRALVHGSDQWLFHLMDEEAWDLFAACIHLRGIYKRREERKRVAHHACVRETVGGCYALNATSLSDTFLSVLLSLFSPSTHPNPSSHIVSLGSLFSRVCKTTKFTIK